MPTDITLPVSTGLTTTMLWTFWVQLGLRIWLRNTGTLQGVYGGCFLLAKALFVHSAEYGGRGSLLAPCCASWGAPNRVRAKGPTSTRTGLPAIRRCMANATVGRQIGISYGHNNLPKAVSWPTPRSLRRGFGCEPGPGQI